MSDEKAKEKFLPHNRWYNVRLRSICRAGILLCNFYNYVKMLVDADFHNKRFDQAGFGGSLVMCKLVPVVAIICLLVIMSGKTVNSASAILSGMAGIHLASIPLPFYQHYHVEWVLQLLIVFSPLSMVSHADAKANRNRIINGTPSFGCYIIAKVVPAVVLAVFAFKLGTVKTSSSEFYLVGGILVFWLASFFKPSYESPLLSLFLGGLLSSLDANEMLADFYFLLVPTVLYIHAVSLTTFPFQLHQKAE